MECFLLKKNGGIWFILATQGKVLESGGPIDVGNFEKKLPKRVNQGPRLCVLDP
jgi:hypothetical protein